MTALSASWPRGRASYRVAASSGDIALTRLRPMYTPGSIQHYLMLAVIVLFPFQIFGLDVGTTKFDLSNLVFVVFVASIALGIRRFPYPTGFTLFFGVYLAIAGIMFFAGPASQTRFASAFLWLTSMIILFGRRDYIPINARIVFWVTLAGVGTVASTLLFQYLFLGNGRPNGVMAEASPAGLILLGATVGLAISARWASSRSSATWSIIGAASLLGLSLITKTTHIVSFAIALAALGLLSRSFSVRTVILGALASGLLYWLFTNDPHYQSRVDIQDASSNLSLLSWLQGYDQMIASLRQYPILGAGLGGTGQFDFYSIYSVDLFRAGLGEMTRQDAFSGLFRLVIEFGPIMAAVILFAIGMRLRQLWRATGDGLLPVGRESQAQVFLFSFAFTLVVGFLLKEPTYSRSHIVLGALLFSVVPLRAVVDVPRQVALQLRSASR